MYHPTMEAKADNSRVLMSDVLRGQVPELEGEDPPGLEALYVHAIVALQVGSKRTALAGILRGVLFGERPELEARVQLEEALDFVRADGLQVLGFELHHGERIVEVPGPFVVENARIDEVSVAEQLCTLSLGLVRQVRRTG